MSKGDWKRPRDDGVSKDQYDENFEAAFGTKEIKTWNPEEDNEQTESIQDQSTCERGSRGTTQSPTPPATDPDGEASPSSGTQSAESSDGGGRI